MTSPPLHELAGQGRLPGHQRMDRATLAWIEANRPAMDFGSIPVPRRALPLLLVPSAAWFTDARQADSIHGIGHSARVSLLASLLAEQHQFDEQDTIALCMAAAVHDCRRRDDRDDPGHGRRAARWFARNHHKVGITFGRLLPPVTVARAVTAIALHDIAYAAFTPADREAAREAWPLVDLLKAADALDRYRLPCRRWWPDPSHLRVDIPWWLHAVAFDLMLATEQARLDGIPYAQALDQARRALFPQEGHADARP
ncbi:HD domain-containing protein [Sphaerimonospora mesophila]|uniref:HD domain-containing protein n=1 Tax=Sphaerimonospora mesophila TaxID=37483 RepID=UPI0006E31871